MGGINWIFLTRTILQYQQSKASNDNKREARLAHNHNGIYSIHSGDINDPPAT
jgi:hypothetical protein